MSATLPDKDPNVKVWLSASQISTMELCERRWFYERVMKLRQPTSPAMQLGIDTENHIEAALKEGTTPPTDKAGLIASAMLPFLPVPGTPGLTFQADMRIRYPIEQGKPDLFGVVGKKDLVIDGVKVWDFKTTGDPAKWMKSPSDLMRDIQAQVYVLDEVTRAGLDELPIEWVYGRTKGAAKGYSSSATMPRETARLAITRARKVALTVLTLKQDGVRDVDTGFNLTACSAFGGCPHRAYCPARAKNLTELLGENDMGIREKLLASMEKNNVEAVGVNPPDAALSPDDKPAAPEVAEVAPVKRTRRTRAMIEADNALAAKLATISHDDPQALEKAGAVLREADNALAAKLATISHDDPQALEKAGAVLAEALISAPVEAAPVEYKYVADRDITLYVDCIPAKGCYAISLDGMVQAATVIAAKKGNVADHRLIEYGKGAAFVLLSFAELFEDARFSGALTINGKLLASQYVLGWLMDRADIVIRGV